MEVRATYQTRVSHASNSLRLASIRLQNLQDQISSGIRLRKPSDGPADYIAAQRAIIRVDQFQAYLDTNSSATNDLNASVSALQEVADGLNQATQVAQEGIHGANTSPAYEALAQQVDALIGRMMTAANSKSDGRSLYAGAATDRTAYAITSTDTAGNPTAITYQGSTDRSQVITGPNQTTDTRYVGSQVFSNGAGDMFQTLIALRDDLRNTSMTSTEKADALTTRMREIDAVRSSVLNATGEQSSSLEVLEAQQSQMRDLQVSLTTRADELQSTDFAQAIAQMNEVQTSYQATLAVTARIFGSTLMDYLK